MRLLLGVRPLVVDELCGVEPGALLRGKPGVRPRLMRVAGQQDTFGDPKAGVVGRERRGIRILGIDRAHSRYSLR